MADRSESTGRWPPGSQSTNNWITPTQSTAGAYGISKLVDLVKRRWLLGGSVALFTATVICSLGFLLPAVYNADAFIRIDPTNKSVLDISAAYGRPPDAAFVETEVNEIVSRPVAEAVVRRLNLQNSEEFGRRPSRWKRLLGIKVAPAGSELFDTAVDRVLKNLQVSREGTSYRVDVRFRSRSPARAALVANSFVSEYLDRSQNIQSTFAATQVKALNDQLERLAESVRAADDDVASYRAGTGLARSSNSGIGTVNDQQIASISAQVALADAAAAEATSRAEGARRQVADKGPENVAEVLASPVVTELRKKRAEIVQEQARILLTYGPLYPASVRVAQQLNDLDRQIDQEARRVISGLESNARTSAAAARNMRETLQTLRSEQSKNLRATVQADSLERDAQAKRITYERVAQAAQQISQDVKVSAGRLSSLAIQPHEPSFPNKPLFLALGLLFGALLGLTATFIADALDRTVRQSRDFIDYLKIPLLGSVPKLMSREISAAGADAAWDYAIQRPRSAYAEALRDLRAALLLSKGGRGQIICVTSSLPREGKSTLALSLARVMAMSGDKVILLDCDKHRSSLRALEPNTEKIGLLEILRDKSQLLQALTLDTAGLHLLLQSAAQVESADLLGSSRMHTLLTILRSAYQFVILDCPPVLAVADACTLGAAADATLLAVKWGSTPRAAVQAATTRLVGAKVRMVGGVLLQVDLTQRSQLDNTDPQFYYPYVRDYIGG